MERTPPEKSEARHASPKTGKRRLWMSLVVVAAVSLAAFLLYRTLSRYSFDEIVESVLAVPVARLAAAAGFAAASYLCLTGFDWLAVRYAGRPLPYRKAALASFCSLSLGHNIGLAALSSGAIRYRFYSRWGLSAGDVAKVILFCGVTVGLGLAILGSVALLLRSDLAAEITGLNRMVVIGLGLACLASAGMYLLLAAFVRQELTVWNWTIEMPSLRLALGQAAIGPLNFACVAACLHQALASAADVPYLAVASVYVIANVTSLISHVPGGLGVIESVVMFLLPGANLVGALLVFRFVYFLVPLALGGTVLGITEIVFRRRNPGGPSTTLKRVST
jgi:glycosyltransferase 2 family protein